MERLALYEFALLHQVVDISLSSKIRLALTKLDILDMFTEIKVGVALTQDQI